MLISLRDTIKVPSWDYQFHYSYIFKYPCLCIELITDKSVPRAASSSLLSLLTALLSVHGNLSQCSGWHSNTACRVDNSLWIITPMQCYARCLSILRIMTHLQSREADTFPDHRLAMAWPLTPSQIIAWARLLHHCPLPRQHRCQPPAQTRDHPTEGSHLNTAFWQWMGFLARIFYTACDDSPKI